MTLIIVAHPLVRESGALSSRASPERQVGAVIATAGTQWPCNVLMLPRPVAEPEPESWPPNTHPLLPRPVVADTLAYPVSVLL